MLELLIIEFCCFINTRIFSKTPLTKHLDRGLSFFRMQVKQRHHGNWMITHCMWASRKAKHGRNRIKISTYQVFKVLIIFKYIFVRVPTNFVRVVLIMMQAASAWQFWKASRSQQPMLGHDFSMLQHTYPVLPEPPRPPAVYSKW